MNKVLKLLFVVLMVIVSILYLDIQLQEEANLRYFPTIRIRDDVKKSTIPKNLHFIWNNLSVPNEFVNNIRGFLKNNPTTRWKYYFWTKECGLKFIREKYGFLLSKVKDATDIFRADVLRYLVIHEYGGVYFDLDTVSIKPLDEYVESHDCSLTSEPGEHLLAWNVRLFINNGALLCVPKHPFYKHIVDQLSMIRDKCKLAVYCTGPVFLSKLFRKFNKTYGNVGQIPRLEPSEIFQDVYDDYLLHRMLTKKCFNAAGLPRKKGNRSNRWRLRGMEKRNLSNTALVYHSWYHIGMRKITFSEEGDVMKLIPGVKLYC